MSGRLKGGVWTGVSRLFSQIVQFAIFMLAAQTMAPSEFGVFALVSAWAILLALVAGAGWPEYVMQWNGDADRPRRVMAIAFLSGGLLTLLGLGMGLLAPLVFSDPAVPPLIQLFALTVVLGSAANTVSGVMNWQERLTAAALAMIVADIVTLAVSVWGLLAGYGVFALAFGKIAGTTAWLLIGLAVVRLSPDFRLRPAEVAEIAQFSVRIVAVRLLTALRLYAGTFIVGGFLGTAEAGYFRAGQRLAGAVAEVLGEPVRILAWSLFRETRNSRGGTAGFQDRANVFLPFVLAFSVPVFACLAVLAGDIVVGLLGEQWRPAAPVLQALAVAHAIFATGTAVEAILSLAGAVRVMPAMMLVNAVIGVLLTLIAAPFGMMATAWAQAAAAALIFVWNAGVMRRHAGIRWTEVLVHARWQAVALAPCLAVPYLLGLAGLRPDTYALLRAAIESAVMLAVFLVSLAALDAGFRATLARLLRRR